MMKFSGKLVVNPRCSSIEHHNFKRNKAIFYVLLFNRLHRGEQQHIADGGAVGEQHHQTVHAEAQTARGRQAVLQCVHVVIVHLCLAVGLDRDTRPGYAARVSECDDGGASDL